MKRWMEYMHLHRGTLGLLGLLTGLYWLMSALYHLPAEPVLYGFLLWLVPAGGLTLWDYMKFSRKHRQLLAAASLVGVRLENLPEASNLSHIQI